MDRECPKCKSKLIKMLVTNGYKSYICTCCKGSEGDRTWYDTGDGKLKNRKDFLDDIQEFNS